MRPCVDQLEISLKEKDMVRTITEFSFAVLNGAQILNMFGFLIVECVWILKGKNRLDCLLLLFLYI